ncbi:MAG: aminotransferase class IV [Cyanobacteria bacterium P01_C01_bin.120]
MSDQSENQYWHDGQLCQGDGLVLSCQEPGWLFGATVFTTLRVYGQSLDHPWTAWRAHIHRTERSLQAFQWCSPDWERVRQGADLLAQRYPVLRVTIFPDGRELVTGRSLPADLLTRQDQGITAWVADSDTYNRALPAHKTGNYLSCWLALQAAQRNAAQEAILTNEQGHWLETSTGSLWGWADGQWWTPPLAAGILPGVMRSRVIQGLQVCQQILQITPWTSAQVAHFSYLAYTNSLVEVVPIHTVLQGAASVNYNPNYDKTAQLVKVSRTIKST